MVRSASGDFPIQRQFASDNNAGVHPEVMRAIAAANEGHAAAYGGDAWTQRTVARFREVFGEETQAFFVFGGTAANALAVHHLTKSYEAIVCAATAHANVDECGAIEATAGRKLLAFQTSDGKLLPGMIERAIAANMRDVHRVQPRVVSISQATEYGTVYSPGELRTLCEAAHAHRMLVHMDGARIANGAAALGVGLREATRDAGVDVLSFGGTKNGLMGAEAVVFFDPALGAEFGFVRKQMLQLASKMRFLAVQLEAILTDDLWLRSALHANAMAALLAESLRGVAGIEISQKVETNAVFARIAPAAIQRLKQQYRFNVWDAATSEVRWMTAFDTTEDDVRSFAAAIRAAVA